MNDPVELTFARDLLLRVVTANVAALHRAAERGLPADAVADVLDRQERLLEWLAGHEGPAVCVAIMAAETTARRSARPRARRAA
jgi:hypothetical protein